MKSPSPGIFPHPSAIYTSSRARTARYNGRRTPAAGAGGANPTVKSSPERLAQEFESTALPFLADLYRTSARVAPDAASAEDAVQETMLEAWKSFRRFEQGTNCRAWLFKILFRCLGHRRRKVNPIDLADAGSELEQLPGLSRPVLDRLSDEDFLAALDKVPAQFREPMLLADVEGFSYKEIASIVGAPVGTVMSRLHRARRMARGHLCEAAETYGYGPVKAGEGS
ncbi:MAG: sigma-70 family RNA polymerase sigma factor [bacterium]|nr:sigma-70 family RNA polymerase sigma factor [bacterium]